MKADKPIVQLDLRFQRSTRHMIEAQHQTDIPEFRRYSKVAVSTK